MKIRLLIIVCSIITCLSVNDYLQPRIIYPFKGPSMCVIGNTDCLQPLKDIQWYLKRVINIERWRVAVGYYNSKMLPNATDMLLLEMDEELRSKAQTYAETCLIYKCLQSEEDNPNGEVTISVTEHDRNAAPIAERVSETLMISHLQLPKRPPEKEMEELVKFSRIPETSRSFHDLAKIIHADVWKVGCGIADFLIPDNKVKFREVVVCFFGPPTLKIGKKLYTAGCVQCSNCPDGTSCVKTEFSGLCEVNVGKLPVYDTHKILEETSCLETGEPRPNPPTEKQTSNTNEGAGENFVWQANKDLSTQQCKGTDLCSSAWIYINDYASIHVVNEKCMSTSVFQAQIYIQKYSCFTFYYRKKIGKSSINVASVMVFAFEVKHRSDLRIKEEKYGKEEADFQPIYLDLPWSNSYIHVGFGTRSDNEDWYMIEVKNFKIENGACPQSENNNSQ